MSNPYSPTAAFPASAAVEPFRFCEIATGEVAGTNAIADIPVGVSLQGVALGEDCTLQLEGVCFLEVDGSGSAIAAGDFLMPKLSGAGVGVKAASTGTRAARALEASSSAGSVIQVQIIHPVTTV